MAIYYVYKATNNLNNKAYVGVSYKPMKRIQSHYRDANLNRSTFYLHNAIRKYGEDAFNWEILDYSTDKDEAFDQLEKWWIKHFDTFRNGYNMTKGGNCGPDKSGTTPSKETRRKMSLAAAGKPKPHLQGRTPWNKGLPCSEEQKQKLRKMKTKGGKPVEVDGVHYKSIAAAALAHKVDYKIMRRWIEKGVGTRTEVTTFSAKFL